MKRSLVITALLVSVFAVVLALQPATGQDRTEERITALETRVAVLETAVAGDDGTSAGVPAATSDVQTFSGTGNTVIEGIAAEAGLLKVKATHDGSSNFAGWLFSPSGERLALLFNEIGAYAGEVAVPLDVDGVYTISVEADGNWTVEVRQ